MDLRKQLTLKQRYYQWHPQERQAMQFVAQYLTLSRTTILREIGCKRYFAKQYFHKSTILTNIVTIGIAVVTNKLNYRPRKYLGFKTPCQVFS